jgi:hypothetical protein
MCQGSFKIHFRALKKVPSISLLNFIFRIGTIHQTRKERNEIAKIQNAAAIHINLIYHIVDFTVGWVLPHRSKQSRKFLKIKVDCIVGFKMYLKKPREIWRPPSLKDEGDDMEAGS